MQKQDQMKKDEKGSCSSSMPKTGSCGSEAKKTESMGSCSSSGNKDKGKGGSCS